MSEETRMILGLFIGIAVMIVLVLKTKTHTFIALLLAALIAGLFGRMSPGGCAFGNSGWLWKYFKEYGYNYRSWGYDGRYPGKIRCS